MFKPESNQTPQVDYILLQITASSAAGLQTLQVYILYTVYRSADSTPYYRWLPVLQALQEIPGFADARYF